MYITSDKLVLTELFGGWGPQKRQASARISHTPVIWFCAVKKHHFTSVFHCFFPNLSVLFFRLLVDPCECGWGERILTFVVTRSIPVLSRDAVGKAPRCGQCSLLFFLRNFVSFWKRLGESYVSCHTPYSIHGNSGYRPERQIYPLPRRGN